MTYDLPAVLHKLGDDLIQGLRCDTHETARLGVVSVGFIQLLNEVDAE